MSVLQALFEGFIFHRKPAFDNVGVVVDQVLFKCLNVLNHLADRSAQWHFYSAIANYGLGYRDVAREHARMAVEMEPDNSEYQNLLNQMSGRRSWFGGTGRRASNFSPLGTIVKLFIGFYAIQFLLSFLGLIF